MQADSAKAEWHALGHEYRTTISSGKSSSAWLRDVLLKPMIIDLLGDQSGNRVLDIGTGDGWIFDAVMIGDRHACDITRPDHVRDDVRFAMADVVSMPYPGGMFDTLVASVVLCYCADLPAAAREMARVTAKGGKAVVALVHPYFYRTGSVDSDGDLHVVDDLAVPASFPIRIGEMVGPFTYHRHQPTEYLNAFAGNGWRLDRAEDGFIPRKAYAALYGRTDTIRRSTKVPLFSFMSFCRDL